MTYYIQGTLAGQSPCTIAHQKQKAIFYFQQAFAKGPCPLDCKEFQAVHPKGDQSLVFIGRTDVEAEAQIFWPPDAKN